ncbi:MAG: AAA family ATPase [Candidatus Omnitrophica bacterium]|nr:AAA family ATPase [Candidatus Omnitrophota bacterium]
MMDPLAQTRDFFRLERDPFAPTADPEFFYFTIEYERCIFGLKRSIDSRYGIVTILGNYGTGKTSLMRALLAHISAHSQYYQTAILSSPNPAWSAEHLMEAICEQFRIVVSPGASLHHGQTLFNRFLYENRNKINTLIIDDAQNLEKKEHIELLRLLQNMETPQHKLLNLVLFGQLELIDLLEAHPNFKQRINNAFRLNSMSFADMKEMVSYRLKKAGYTPEEEVFDQESLEAIYEESRGIPREVVNICRNCLMIAHRIGRGRVQKSIVQYAINNTMAIGVFREKAPIA